MRGVSVKARGEGVWVCPLKRQAGQENKNNRGVERTGVQGPRRVEGGWDDYNRSS